MLRTKLSLELLTSVAGHLMKMDDSMSVKARNTNVTIEINVFVPLLLGTEVEIEEYDIFLI